jgi:hypothetical protein
MLLAYTDIATQNLIEYVVANLHLVHSTIRFDSAQAFLANSAAPDQTSLKHQDIHC